MNNVYRIVVFTLLSVQGILKQAYSGGSGEGSAYRGMVATRITPDSHTTTIRTPTAVIDTGTIPYLRSAAGVEEEGEEGKGTETVGGGGKILEGIGPVFPSFLTETVPPKRSNELSSLVARYNNEVLPSISNVTVTNVTCIKEQTVYLHCSVLNLGTRSVSWVRNRDLNVLTVGRQIFTSEGRFLPMNKPGSNVWTLRLQFPQLSDSGGYNCQINTLPPISVTITLNVVEPEATITTEPKLFLDHGSPLNITCQVKESPSAPDYLLWYHQDKNIISDPTRTVNITTELGLTTTSTLFVPNVTPRDSGIYICAPQGTKEASVSVIVVTGEQPRAVQPGSSSQLSMSTTLLFLLTFLAYRWYLPFE